MTTRHGSLRWGRWWVLGAVLMAVLLVAAACGGEEPTATPRAPGVPTATTAPRAPTATTAPGMPTATTAPLAPTATTAPLAPTATRVVPTPTPTVPPLAEEVETFTWDFTWSSPGELARSQSYALADRLEAAFGGRLTIRRHEAGSVVPGYNELQGIEVGALEMATTAFAAGTFISEYGLALNFTAIAGHLGPLGGVMWGTLESVQDTWREVFAGKNILVFPSRFMYTTEPWALCAKDKPLFTIEDHQGVKFRMYSYFLKVTANMGMNPIDIAQTELFSALERGVVECADVASLSNNLSRFFEEITTVWYFPGLHAQGAAGGVGLAVSEEAFNELPPDLQLAFVTVANGYGWDLAWEQWREDINALRRIREENLVRLERLPRETQLWIRENIYEVFDEAVDAELAKGRPHAKIQWESQKAYDALWQPYWRAMSVYQYNPYYPVPAE